MDMETAMADVGKVIDFAPGQREKMASDNLKLASDRLIASSGMTGVDLANIEYAAGQSGIGNDQKDASGNVDQAAKQKAIMEFTRDAAIMGSAFDVSAKESGEIMAGWRASMMLTRDQTLDLADSTNYLGNNFNASSADIASVVKRYGAIGSASGLKPEQTAALSAALLNPGTEKEIAGTGFKNFLGAMTKGSAATKGQKETWEELGFDPEDLAAQMQQDAPKTIMTVLEALKAQPQEKQSALATQLFGSESIGAIQPLLLNLGEVQRAFDLVGDKSKYATSAMADGKVGSMMQEAAGVANTSRTGWNSFTASLTRLSTLIGTAMLPALNYVLGPLGSMVGYLADAAEKFPNITAALAVAAGGMTLLKGGALALKYVGLMLGQGANRGALARAKLDASTASTATQANLAVARLNATMGRLGASGGVGGGGGGGKGGKGGKLSRVGPGAAVPRAPFMAPKGGGTVGKLLSTAPALAAVAAESAPSALGKVAAMGRSLGTGAKVASKAALPLMLISGGLQAADGIANGDSEQVGGAVGGMAGGMAGGWAGAATGAALGTLIFPGVGTAIGGAIGGIGGSLAGSGAGEWLGEKLGALVDKLSAPDDVAKDVVKGAAAATPMVFSPSITMTPTGDAAYDQRLTDQIMARLKGEMMPMMMANDPLAQRRGASLTDGSE
jgi:TP901 family phage tail tape measure protein